MRYPTLTRNNDFRRAYARGKSLVGYSLVVYVIKNRAGCTRIGITCSKKTGNAVHRNRARRVIRAAAAAVLPPEGVGSYDLVFVARTSTAGQKSTQVAAVMRKLLTKAGLPTRPAAPQPGHSTTTTSVSAPVQQAADPSAAAPLPCAGEHDQ